MNWTAKIKRDSLKRAFDILSTDDQIDYEKLKKYVKVLFVVKSRLNGKMSQFNSQMR